MAHPQRATDSSVAFDTSEGVVKRHFFAAMLQVDLFPGSGPGGRWLKSIRPQERMVSQLSRLDSSEKESKELGIANHPSHLKRRMSNFMPASPSFLDQSTPNGFAEVIQFLSSFYSACSNLGADPRMNTACTALDDTPCAPPLAGLSVLARPRLFLAPV